MKILLCLGAGAAIALAWHYRPYRPARQTHSSFDGVALRIVPDGGRSLALLLGDVTHGLAVTHGVTLDDVDLTSAPVARIALPDVPEVLAAAQGAARDHEHVRVEVVHSRRGLILFSISDDLGRGVSHQLAELPADLRAPRIG